ncbi:TetR family transcriptional regulator [Lentzea sp. NBRC 105346]|uniref:TetR/AcrR family transcriptional regulator n=1 Tax=Lentzea sp. NBRC 105346 TaxID=3032205 RepID=UPI0024A1E84F|nr:TetR/AcrR family transcriptional regulator [Lentzea sp. NBRC 105346]GLZ33733.1 TetR family transcriptional regulator [Lentzea sp. NBRC 105346]
MVVFAGQGDPRRSLALLWRTHDDSPRPGPKQGLTVDSIVDAAIGVADESGMAALSMRAVGERLGRTAMALYTYVPNKSELVDLMYDRTLGELPADYPVEDGWRPAVTAWAEQLWAFYLRHPWMLHVSQARPVLGPNSFGSLEAVAGILRTTGLPAARLRPIVSALVHYVRGSAESVTEARDASTATGTTDDAWWAGQSAALQEVAPDFAARFPMLTWLQSEDPDDVPDYEHKVRSAFADGLAVLLDGVAAAIRSAAETSRPRRPTSGR